jgi:hypothetical protein
MLIEVVELTLQRFKPLSRLPEFPFGGQSLVISEVTGGVGNEGAGVADGRPR